MEPIYKQYVALATKWNKDVLFRARIQLTLAYIVVSAFIVGIASHLLFNALLVSLADSIADQVPSIRDQARLFEQAEGVLEFKIILADIFIIVIICVCAYVLTEIALRPIREARNRERRFLADAAHELRTPLSVMRSGNEVVLRGEKNLSPRAIRQFTENIEEIDTLTRIANGLLALTSKKQMAIDGESVIQVGELLESVIQRLRPLGTEKGVSLSLTIDANIEKCSVRGDHATLSRAFENLIENGIKYTKSGGSVTVTLKQQRDFAVIEIKDTGIGISPKDLPHVTEPFFRSDVARTANEGSGLGLSIVSETVDALNGTLSIESELGVGTTVTVSLPIEKG